MSTVETFRPARPAEYVQKQSTQSCYRDAYDRSLSPATPLQSAHVPEEFGTFTISHPKTNTTQIKTGIADNEFRKSSANGRTGIQSGDTSNQRQQASDTAVQAERNFYYQPVPRFGDPDGLDEAKQKLQSAKPSGFDDILLGLQVGDVEAVLALANMPSDLANAVLSQPMRFGNFLANSIVNPDQAMKDATAWGDDTGKALVSTEKAALGAGQLYLDINEAIVENKLGIHDSRPYEPFAQMLASFDELSNGQKTEILTEGGILTLSPLAIGKTDRLLKETCEFSTGVFTKFSNELLSNPFNGNAVALPVLAYGDVPIKLPTASAVHDWDQNIAATSRADRANDWQSELGREVPSSSTESTGFRGDKDIYSQVNEKGRRKSYINGEGDLCPADPVGVYKGRKVSAAEHIEAQYCRRAKEHSPYTSFSTTDSVIAKYGGEGIKLGLDALREAIAKGEVTGVRIIEHEELVEKIRNSYFKRWEKIKLLDYVNKDREILVEGVIPKRFLTILGSYAG